MPVTRQRQQSAALRQAEPVNSLPRCLSSRELLGAAQALLIEHNGCYHSLRLTRQNKLILTK